MTDAHKLAESLRNMRSVARRHHDGTGGKVRWSVVLDTEWAGDLTDAADLIERLAAEIKALKEAPAVLLTDEQINMIFYPLGNAGRIELMVARMNARDVEAAVLAANGKAVP